MKRHSCMIPPRSRSWPDKLDTGSVARLLAGTLGWAAAVSLALFALALVAGCNPPPAPHTIEVSSTLPESVLVSVSIARDAWCASTVGWCPEIVEYDGEASIVVEDFDGACTVNTPEGRNCSGAHNDGRGKIGVSPLSAQMTVEELAGQITHEFGHFGIDGHVRSSALMHAVFSGPADIPTRVDTQAAMAWCDALGC